MEKGKYRANTSDIEYFDNWINQYGLLCTPQAQLGLIGSAFFIGVIIAMCFVPQFSDKYGRKPFIVMTLTIQLIALWAMKVTTNLYVAIFAVFILGFSHPGKNIVFLNYCVEMIPENFKKQLMALVLLIEAAAILFIAGAY